MLSCSLDYVLFWCSLQSDLFYNSKFYLVSCITTCSELQWKVLFLELSVCGFCLCVNLGNHWTDLRQIHMEDMFDSSLRRGWRSRSPGTKTTFFGLFGGLPAVYIG